jgi:hypothetical protein
MWIFVFEMSHCGEYAPEIFLMKVQIALSSGVSENQMERVRRKNKDLFSHHICSWFASPGEG